MCGQLDCDWLPTSCGSCARYHAWAAESRISPFLVMPLLSVGGCFLSGSLLHEASSAPPGSGSGESSGDDGADNCVRASSFSTSFYNKIFYNNI